MVALRGADYLVVGPDSAQHPRVSPLLGRRCQSFRDEISSALATDLSVDHEEKLREMAQRAAELAKLIHQEWGSAAPGGGLQTRVNVDMPKHGPDKELLRVEGLLGDVIKAIDTYLRRPPEGY